TIGQHVRLYQGADLVNLRGIETEALIRGFRNTLLLLRMAGLSSRERTGCNSLLNLMSESDLRSLFDTVTNSQRFFAGSVQDLKKAIILNSNDAAEFLKRRKVQRDLILQYLAKEEIVMPPNSEKTPLIERTLRFWSSEE
ncbi:unnamed protein product, partial [Arctogadus glacialis]